MTSNRGTVTCSPWTTPELARACARGLDPDYDLTSAIDFVSEILFRLSGRQYPGICTQTVWPCLADDCHGFEDPAWTSSEAASWRAAQSGSGTPSIPYPTGNGGWDNMWSSPSDMMCSSCRLPWLTLPGPIVSVEEVVVGGLVLPPSSYVIEGGRRIGRTDGGYWPCSNNLHDTTLFQDGLASVVVSGDNGTWTLSIFVDGVESQFLIDVADSAEDITFAIEAELGPGSVSVTGGPADDVGSNPFVISINAQLLTPPFNVGAAYPNLAIGVDPGSVDVTVVSSGSAPAPGAWYVTYSYGKPVPPGGVFAASVFAVQVALARCGSTECTLPARLKEISREGVDMAFADPLEFIGKGEVGIYEVDLWLNSVNPKKIQRRASVYRADAPKPAQRF